MKSPQTEKRELNNGKNGKYVLIAMLLIFIIGGVILSYFLCEKKSAPVIQKENNKNKEAQKEEPAPIPAPPEKWETYTSSELGFSIKYPEMVYGINRCEFKKQFYVPLKVFEDKENGIVYITEEYYYEAPYDGKLNKFTGPCEKITYSLESLKKARENIIYINDKVRVNANPFLSRVFIIKNIESDEELNKFIKDNYGQGCFVANKIFWKQNEVYEIEIKGEDWDKTDLGTTTCPINYVYKILYASEKNKLMSVILGQECGFGTEYISEESYKCYDEEMINSFEFK